VLPAALISSACAGTTSLPPPRPLIVSSGARLTVDQERLQEIYDWLIPQVETIQQDPTFMIEGIESEEDRFPWETLVMVCCSRVRTPLPADSARYRLGRTNPDVDTPYNIYAHLHLMDRRGTLKDWLPDADTLRGYDRERAIVKRMADSWLLGRAIFDAQPHSGMDELIYASEQGYLDAFLFTARGNEFTEAREAWVAQNPGGLEAYQTWFRQTFRSDPPGIGTRARGR
jgi:hypothetical protein